MSGESATCGTSPPGANGGTLHGEALWHDLECGGYEADLALWRRLAREAAGPVLDLGAGTGRVALALAREGAAVVAVDRGPELLDELERRGRREGLDLRTVCADVRALDLGERFALALAPMQLLQLLGGPGGRAAALRGARAHLGPQGRLAAALLASDRQAGDDAAQPIPDVLERDRWVYSSLPVAVDARGGALEVRRLRQVVSPGGALREEVSVSRLDLLTPAELEHESAAAGFRPAGRVTISPTREHVGSEVLILEAC